MFRDCINKPIDPIPKEYIKTICKLDNEPDYSLTCLGIALLKPRMEKYTGIGGAYNDFVAEDTCLDDFLSKNADNEKPLLYYYRYNNKTNDQKAFVEKLKANGYEIKESIGALLEQKAETRCVAVYHKEKNIAGIFINSRDIRFYHMLISFLSLLFPALFKDKPLAGQDYEVIKALSKTSKDAFVEQIQIAVRPYVTEFRRMMLSNLLISLHNKKIESARVNVDRQRSYVRDAEEAFAQQVKKLKELIVIFEGMKATEKSDQVEEDLIDYLSSNNQIHNLAINGSFLTFSIFSLLNNYNPDAWELFKERGYIYDGKYTHDGRFDVHLLDAFKDKNNRKLLLDNIFSEDPVFTVKMAGNFTLDLDGCTSNTRRGYNYTEADPVFKSCMPNPHLKFYECLGGYKTKIAQALKERNYISAIELCIASTGSVDLDETEQTFRPFIGYIMSSKEKVLRRKDGVDMTPEEALLYLVEKGE